MMHIFIYCMCKCFWIRFATLTLNITIRWFLVPTKQIAVIIYLYLEEIMFLLSLFLVFYPEKLTKIW